jgi:hypothetical protein
MHDTASLRKLAKWYRAFAIVADSGEHEGRVKVAEYLERKAEELEQRDARRTPIN